jgi:hypothetical protein
MCVQEEWAGAFCLLAFAGFVGCNTIRGPHSRNSKVIKTHNLRGDPLFVPIAGIVVLAVTSCPRKQPMSNAVHRDAFAFV